MTTLAEALPEEQARVRRLIGIYKSLGPTGAFGAMMLEQALRVADAAVMSGDVVAMLHAYEKLKDCQ